MKQSFVLGRMKSGDGEETDVGLELDFASMK
jgi:hypothetical protein